MVKTRTKLHFYFFFVLLLSLGQPVLALSSLQSQVDKNPALAGEAITLTVTADARLNANALNYRHLEQHFRVMVPSVSQSTQIINGQSSHITRWSFTLFPLTTGDIRIPAFEINGIVSNSIELTVLADTVRAGQPRELFVEASLQGSTEVYVQEMLYYDVVIYFSGDLQRGNLTEPQLEGAEIQRVGQDVEGSTLVDGIRYRTITRRYSITPQRSGTATIAPPLFSGEVIERDNSRYNYFARSKNVMQEANPIVIEVKPQPEGQAGRWLVAGLVTLTEEWQPEKSVLTVGEPVTRIITLSAVDVLPSQLPELNQQLPTQLRHYQEQAQAKGAERSGRLVAQKIFTTAIIANDSGELTLPEIRLPWWNSQTKRQEFATLPARVLQVNASVIDAVPVSLPMSQTATVTASHWQWNYTSTLLLLGWLLSVAIMWFVKKAPADTTQTGTAITYRKEFNDKHLKHACQKGDATRAATELLKWGSQQFSVTVMSLGELKHWTADNALAQELDRLALTLYGPGINDWQGEQLWQAWQKWRPTTQQQTRSSLAALYPH